MRIYHKAHWMKRREGVREGERERGEGRREG